MNREMPEPKQTLPDPPYRFAAARQPPLKLATSQPTKPKKWPNS
jgi:hypothetical protein